MSKLYIAGVILPGLMSPFIAISVQPIELHFLQQNRILYFRQQ